MSRRQVQNVDNLSKNVNKIVEFLGYFWTHDEKRIQVSTNMPGIGIVICDMIKGNESLVQNFNFYFLTPLSQIFQKASFGCKPYCNWISGSELCRI